MDGQKEVGVGKPRHVNQRGIKGKGIETKKSSRLSSKFDQSAISLYPGFHSGYLTRSRLSISFLSSEHNGDARNVKVDLLTFDLFPYRSENECIYPGGAR